MAAETKRKTVSLNLSCLSTPAHSTGSNFKIAGSTGPSSDPYTEPMRYFFHAINISLDGVGKGMQRWREDGEEKTQPSDADRIMRYAVRSKVSLSKTKYGSFSTPLRQSISKLRKKP